MKTFLILIIRFYQIFISPVFRTVFGAEICRYKESCSNYAVRAVKENGAVKGIFLSLRRLLSCQPFGRIGIDA